MHKVSVILPVFNAANFIKDAIKSILDQSFSEFELLIINDGSTDNTNKIICGFADSRIKIIHNYRNLGLITTLNIGLSLAQGEYIFRMDADDVSHPERILKQVQFMEANVDVAVCGANRFALGKEYLRNGKTLNSAQVKVISIFNCPLVHPSVCIRKSFLANHELKYDENFRHAEDNALWLEILKKGGRITVLSDNLLGYRQHEEQVSAKFREEQKGNSTKARVGYLKDVFGIELNNVEIKLYEALSYKEDVKSRKAWDSFPYFIRKLKNAVLHTQLTEENELFLNVLYSRIRLLYLINSKHGLTLYLQYLRFFLLDRRINIGMRLFIKAILKI